MAMERVLTKIFKSNFLSILFLSSVFISFASARNLYVYPQGKQQSNSISTGTRETAQMNFSGTPNVQYPNLQAAIDDSVDGDTIFLARGVWKGDGNRDLDFKGKKITVSGLRPEDSNYVAATIIDCEGTESYPHRGFYFHTKEDSNSVVCGITIKNGYYSSASGIYCGSSAPYIHHCLFINNKSNYSRDNGSTIYYYITVKKKLIIESCKFSDNSGGSAVYISGYGCIVDFSINDCEINNTTGSFSYLGAGGIYCFNSNGEISNCRIEKNQYYGIISASSTVNITDCLIRGNGTAGTTSAGISDGGRSTINVKNSSIIGNIGIGINGSSYLNVNNCFIGYNLGNGVNNSTKILDSKIIGNSGVGINNPLIVNNCIVAKNKKQGIYYPYYIVSNCTVIDNNSCGIQVAQGSAYITNCIIRYNYGDQIKGVTSSTKITYTNSYKNDTSVGYPSNIPYTGIGNIDKEPNFVSEKDYHLLTGSGCIDAGTNDVKYYTTSGIYPVIEPNDIDGSARIIDGDSNGTATADIGAYEYNTNQPVTAVWADRIVCLKNDCNGVKGKIYVKNAGVGTLNYEITSDEKWLTIDNPSGASGGEVQEINVSINPDSLELGNYYCRVKVYSNEAVNKVAECWLCVHIGTLWTVPTDVNTIQAAINAAKNFDYIRVMDGNYTGDGNRNINFNGKNIVLYSESGNPDNCIINCNKMDGLKLITREDEAVIDGFTISNAHYGITCDVCSVPEIKNCRFNYCYYGIYLDRYSSAKIENCNFKCYGIYSLNCNKILLMDSHFPRPTFYGLGLTGQKFEAERCDFESAIGCSMKNTIINNCQIHDTAYQGIFISSTGKFIMSNCSLKNIPGSIREYAALKISNVGQGTISNCRINSERKSCTAIYITSSASAKDISIQNSLLAGNDTVCYLTSSTTNNVKFENCTITENRTYVLSGSGRNTVSFKNCIIWDANIVSPSTSGPVIPNITYCDVKGGWAGVGNINVEPDFVQPGYWDPNGTPADANDDFWVEGDYHLKSQGWRWNSDANDWTYDNVTSRCIDAGSPGYPLRDELLSVPQDPYNEFGENLRIDMGYYGGTSEASIPPYRWALVSDMDNSGRVNMADFGYFGGLFGMQGSKLDSDFNRDGVVDIEDLALLANDWLKVTSWAGRR